MDTNDASLPRLQSLCSRLAHELNNSLGILQGHLELLKLELGDSLDGRQSLSDMAQTCKRLRQRSLDFEWFAGNRKLSLTQMDLLPLLQDSLQSWPELQLQRTGAAPVVWADFDCLRQILQDLLQGACGTIVVQGDDSRVEVVATWPIAEAVEADSIFDPLFTLPGQRQSLSRALGMALAQQGALRVQEVQPCHITLVLTLLRQKTA